ncbi:MAG: hypothetical protein Q9197_000707 [Variospora fuerteventurae]
MLSVRLQSRPRSKVALNLRVVRRATLSTWLPVPEIRHDKVETFRKTAFLPSLPAKVPIGTFQVIPAALKWFGESRNKFNSSYLGQFAGHMIPLELTRHLLPVDAKVNTISFQRAEAPFNIFLGWAAQANGDTPERLYVAQAPLNRLPKPLQDDLPTPELVATAGRGDVYDASVWLGVAPTYTPLHRDPNPNLYLQLAGRKVVRLLEPGFGQTVFAAVQAELGRQHSSKFRGEEMMKGEERRLLEAKIWLDKPAENQEKFAGLETTVEADEYLFIPTGWWHSVKSIGTGCTASVGEPRLWAAFLTLITLYL